MRRRRRREKATRPCCPLCLDIARTNGAAPIVRVWWIRGSRRDRKSWTFRVAFNRIWRSNWTRRKTGWKNVRFWKSQTRARFSSAVQDYSGPSLWSAFTLVTLYNGNIFRPFSTLSDQRSLRRLLRGLRFKYEIRSRSKLWRENPTRVNRLNAM